MQVSLLQAILQTEEIKRCSALKNMGIAGLSPARVKLFQTHIECLLLFLRLISNMTAEIGGSDTTNTLYASVLKHTENCNML